MSDNASWINYRFILTSGQGMKSLVLSEITIQEKSDLADFEPSCVNLVKSSSFCQFTEWSISSKHKDSYIYWEYARTNQFRITIWLSSAGLDCWVELILLWRFTHLSFWSFCQDHIKVIKKKDLQQPKPYLHYFLLSICTFEMIQCFLLDRQVYF